MFIGQYEHHLEKKNRLSVPKKFRSQLENGGILSQGLDGCLFLYPKAAWTQLVAKISQLPLTKADARDFTRGLSFGAVEVETDSLGRILIPDYLRQFAGIKNDCMIAGAVDRVEIWASDRFIKYTTQINSRREEIAEKLSEAGI
jgi:MraZ protein